VNAIDMPTVSVAGKEINSGDRARAFASYMRIHSLEATGGYTYAQMGRFQAKPDTPKAQLAVGGGDGQPAVGRDGHRDEAAGCERRPQHLGDRDGADDRAEHVLHGRQAGAVRDRGRGSHCCSSGIGFIILAFAALHRRLVSAPCRKRQTTGRRPVVSA
jgi:hypothetical protein